MKKIITILGISCLAFIMSGCDVETSTRATRPTTEDKNQPYKRENNSIYMGYYPQTSLSFYDDDDRALIEILNTEINGFDESKWTSYTYFADYSARHPEMYYYDYDRDNDGSFDYRAVYINHDTSDNYSSWRMQEKNGYYGKMIYWFKYEKVKWDILEEKNGKAFIIANLVIDSQPFQNTNSGTLDDESFEHNGGKGYSNNYELSDIRKWLNNEFYNSVFSEANKTVIEKTNVDNSKETTNNDTYNQYVSNNTEDYIYLLSYEEADSYYKTNETRSAIASDYAKCQGAYGGTAMWGLRSPNDGKPFAVEIVHSAGFIDYDVVNHCSIGIRPCMWIKL